MVTHRPDEHAEPCRGDGSYPLASTQDQEVNVERDESSTRGSKGDNLHSGQNNTSGISSNPDDGLSGGRTCRGCLYFSKSQKQSGIQAPICVGISKFESYPGDGGICGSACFPASSVHFLSSQYSHFLLNLGAEPERRILVNDTSFFVLWAYQMVSQSVEDHQPLRSI